MKTVFLLFAVLFFFPGFASATDRTATPDSLQGVWSSPDCTMADQVWIISKHFFIHTLPRDIAVGGIGDWRQEEDKEDRYFHLDAGGKNNTLINLTNDGLMRTIKAPAAESPLSVQWSMEAGNPEEYSHCAKLFDSRPALGQREVNSIFLLDHAVENCNGLSPQDFGTATQCQKSLFDLVDSDTNGALSRDEMIQLHRQLEFLQAGGALCPGAPVFYPSGSERSAAFADDILGRTNGKTAFADLQSFFRSGQKAGTLFQGLDRLLPFLSSPATACDTAPLPQSTVQQNNLGANPQKDAPQYPVVPVAIRP
ncbi:MAG: hypothetical protein ACXW4B_05745 [Micavibrio sp.]